MSKCGDCMKARNQQTRQLAGCGYEPPPAAHLLAYVKPWAGLGYKGKQPKTCPGYTTSLPEVIEVARARLHWSKGELSAFVKGRASDALTVGIEILDGAVNDLQSWAMTPKDKGGGA